MSTIIHPSSASWQPYAYPVSSPKGMVLAQGGIRGREMPFYLPPAVSLRTSDRSEILQILKYAGIHYRAPDSEAAQFGVQIFNIGRDFARHAVFDHISFDWDHTLSNYQIFENLAGVIKAKSSKKPPSEELAQKGMVAIETPRPFMQELALGMMIGYAIRQGLQKFDQWENYEPQVGIATHTWPDRIAVLATWFVRLLPLMEGLLPGTPGLQERLTYSDNKAILHLHNFLSYADKLMSKFEHGGFSVLTPQERAEVLAYLKDGKAHYQKPVGAFLEKGWASSSMLHFEDSTKIVEAMNGHVSDERAPRRIRALHVRHTHSSIFGDVKEWHKISVLGLWRSREQTMVEIAQNLAKIESVGSTIPSIIGALQVFSSGNGQAMPDLKKRFTTPEGVVLMVHETPTTVGEYWKYYVEPTNRLKAKIHRIQTERKSGLG